jgi:hypothetical protein
LIDCYVPDLAGAEPKCSPLGGLQVRPDAVLGVCVLEFQWVPFGGVYSGEPDYDKGGRAMEASVHRYHYTQVTLPKLEQPPVPEVGDVEHFPIYVSWGESRLGLQLTPEQAKEAGEALIRAAEPYLAESERGERDERTEH